MKRISLGMSYRSKEESFLAGQEAVQMALDNLQGSANFLYIATTLDYNQSEVLRGIYSIADIPAIGCPAEGIIFMEGRRTQHMVAVMAFQLQDVQLFIEYGQEGNHEDSKKVGEAFAEKIASHLLSVDRGDTSPVLFIFVDNRLIAHRITESMANTLGPLVSVAGGSAHSSGSFCGPFLNNTVRDRAVVGGLVYPHTPIGIGVAHGWFPSGQSVVATRTEDNRIFELNWRPAFDMYQEIWKDIFPDLTGKSHREIQQEFSRFAAYHPFGLAQVTEEYLIRDPYTVLEDGSILCAGGVPENAILHFMHGEPKILSHAAKTVTQQAIDQLEGHPIEAVLFFDCITRFNLPDYNMLDELDHIKAVIGRNVPLLGVTSRGEIANPKKGPTVYHNKALVLSAFST